jgi:transposase
MRGGIAHHLGIGAETLQPWATQQEIDRGLRLGLPTAQRWQIAASEEVRELRRANQLLKAAPAFFDFAPARVWGSVVFAHFLLPRPL